MTTDQIIQVLILICTATVPTFAFIYFFGRLANKVDNLDREIANTNIRFDTNINEVKTEVRELRSLLISYMMTGNKTNKEL